MPYYGSSGDIRADLAGGLASTADNFIDEDEVSGALIERGRRHAYAVINGKLEPAFPVEVPWVSGGEPLLVSEISNRLSMCFVYRRINPDSTELSKDRKTAFCDEPMEILEELAEGTMELSEVTNPFGDKVFHTRANRKPATDMGPIENQRIDPDLLDDIEDRRL